MSDLPPVRHSSRPRLQVLSGIQVREPALVNLISCKNSILRLTDKSGVVSLNLPLVTNVLLYNIALVVFAVGHCLILIVVLLFRAEHLTASLKGPSTGTQCFYFVRSIFLV